MSQYNILDVFANKKQYLYKYLLITNYMKRNKKEIIITNIQNEYLKRSRYLKSKKGSRHFVSKSKSIIKDVSSALTELCMAATPTKKD
jgi:hypothetical protein